MNVETVSFLKNCFGDYYSNTSINPPVNAGMREWGHIEWSIKDDTRMHRHNTLLDYGSLMEYLTTHTPQHVYFSAAKYNHPSADSTDAKLLDGADLIFDLDADHIPGYDESKYSYSEMLERCKEELTSLLALLESDFGIEDYDVIFSGGRGYHVHVRSDDLQYLDSDARSEIVEYIIGESISLDSITYPKQNGNAEYPKLYTKGGWGERVHVHAIEKSNSEDFEKYLLNTEGIGAQTMKKIIKNRDAIENGEMKPESVMRKFYTRVLNEVIFEQGAAIDEPVTTDIHRLIRLPGSLHGGSGLCVTRIDDIESFNPLVDAVPREFKNEVVSITPTKTFDYTFNGEEYSFSSGDVVELSKPLAIHLMASGKAKYTI